MTTNRPTPEGAWDVVPHNMEDTLITPLDVKPAASNALLAMEILHYEKENRKMMSGWKTIAFNMALAVVGVLQTANWVDVIPGPYTGPLVAVIGMVGIWLRSVTKTPVGAAQEKK